MKKNELTKYQRDILEHLNFIGVREGEYSYEDPLAFPIDQSSSSKERESQIVQLESHGFISTDWSVSDGLRIELTDEGKEYLDHLEIVHSDDEEMRKKVSEKKGTKNFELKHALSTKEKDKILLNKRYQNQGFIGYVLNAPTAETVPLHQVYLKGKSNDYFYYIAGEKEQFDNIPQTEKKLIGHLVKKGEPQYQLRRYLRESTIKSGSEIDHFYCTKPDEKILEGEYHYKEQPIYGSEPVFLLSELGQGREPLYVYSTHPEVRLFTNTIEIKEKVIIPSFDASAVSALIASKTHEEIWWVNAREKWDMETLNIGDIERYHAKGSSKRYKNYVRSLRVGHLLIGYQAGSVGRIIGIFQITKEVDENDEYHFTLLYKFQKRTSYQDLKSLPIFGRSSFAKSLQGSILKFENKEIIDEIIGTTEIGPFLNQEVVDLDVNEPEIPNPSTIARLAADSIEGEDELDIMTDVRAFARVMAAQSFTPPLAIALFGKWGSGKSFFMHKLAKTIKEYTDENSADEEQVYYEGIAQIHFNAWSYLDANLWASIVTRIFEGLRDHFAKGESSEYLHETEERLSQVLSIFQKKNLELVDLRKELSVNVEKLEEKKEKLVTTLAEQMGAFKTNTLQSAWKKVREEFNAQSRIGKVIEDSSFAASEFKSLVPEHFWNNPVEAYERSNSQYLFLRELISKRTLVYAIILIGGIAAIWFGIGKLNLETTFPQMGLSLIAFMGMAWKRAMDVYRKVSPLLNGLLSVKKDYERELEAAKEKFYEDEKALKLEIEEQKEKLTLVKAKIQSGDDKITELEFKLNNFVATEALHSFVDEKGKNKAYQKHLGIVSIIRKDFEELSKLFAEHNDEARKKELSEEYGKPLQRIILYVDDLDRCPEDRVIEVLEAVNLLMAFKLFIVVVGVDQRWVKNALRKRHRLHFSGSADDDEMKGFELISASDYLEKIFQVPFHLKEANEEGIKRLVTQLTPNIAATTDPDHGKAEDNDENTLQPGIDAEKPLEEDHIDEMNTEPDSEPQSNEPAETNGYEDQEEIDLQLSPEEAELLRETSVLVGNNPRAIKRFVNIYQIARSHAALGINKNSAIDEYAKLIVLLALAGGPYKSIYKELREIILDSESGNGTIELSYLIHRNMEKGDKQVKQMNANINAIMEENEVLKRLLDQRLYTFLKQCEFIQRFTFEELI